MIPPTVELEPKVIVPPAALLNIATSVEAFGTFAGLQLLEVAQAPPPFMFHERYVWACAAAAAVKTTHPNTSRSKKPTRPRTCLTGEGNSTARKPSRGGAKRSRKN
jgi:hypothetical protein